MIVARSPGRTGARAIAERPRHAPLGHHPGVSARGDGLEREDGRRRGGDGLERDDRLQPRQLVAHLLQLLELLGGRYDRHARARVPDDVARLRRVQRRVHRHRDGSDRDDREIGQEPLGPALRHDDNPIAAFDAEGAKPEREIAEAIEPVAGRLPHHRPAAHLSDDQRLRVASEDVEGQVGERRQLGGRFLDRLAPRRATHAVPRISIPPVCRPG